MKYYYINELCKTKAKTALYEELKKKYFCKPSGKKIIITLMLLATMNYNMFIERPRKMHWKPSLYYITVTLFFFPH